MYHIWQGLAEELSKEDACDRAIFPDTSIVINRCALIGNLSVEGVRRTLLYQDHNVFFVPKHIKHLLILWVKSYS